MCVKAQDFFFENKSINLPIKPSDFEQGSSKIVPWRLSSSKILFSLFAILVYFFILDESTYSIIISNTYIFNFYLFLSVRQYPFAY